MAVTRLRQVCIVTADLAAEVRFLKDVVGLSVQFQDGEEGLGAPSGMPVPVRVAVGPRRSI